MQIVVKRNNKMRGQAFVVFREIAASTAAKNNLNGYAIFGKAMVHIVDMIENKVFRQKIKDSGTQFLILIQITSISNILSNNYNKMGNSHQ